MKPMTKTEIRDAISDRLAVSKTIVAKVLNEHTKLMRDRIMNDDPVRIDGIGTIRTRHVAATTRRNPRTGGTVQVPAKRVAKLKASDDLNRDLNRQAETTAAAP